MENKEQLNPNAENENLQRVENLESNEQSVEKENIQPVDNEQSKPETSSLEPEPAKEDSANDPVENELKAAEPETESEAQPQAEESKELEAETPEAVVENSDIIAETAETKTSDAANTPQEELIPATEESIEPEKVSEVSLKATPKASYTPGNEDEDLAEKYKDLSREQLVETIEALVKNEDVNFIRQHIAYVKLAFRSTQNVASEDQYKIEASDKSEENKQEEGQEKEEIVVVDELLQRFNDAFAIYKQKKKAYDMALERQMQENLKIKENILEELRKLIESEEELKKTYDTFKELQEKWRETGPVPQSSKNTLWNNYNFLVEKFFDKVKINKELKDLDLKKNLEAKTELCEKAEELLLETSVNKSFQQLQKLHEAWKETGPVPKDQKDDVWERFKAATDTLNHRRQEYYNSLREEQNKNYAAKVVLCEQAESIAEVQPELPKDWQENTEKINELFKVWKTIGFAPRKVNNEVWNRFRSALDNFFKNKKQFFGKYKDEQSENYNQKLNLCIQAEALKDSEDWKQTTDQLISLQQEWKKIGPVPSKFSDKIWKRFRAACDEFFNRKSEYFANIGEKQDENLKKKKELIQEVANHAYSEDNAENLNTLKDFQRRWMEIGHVPIKQKDNIQNEFRKTINDQFEKLNLSKKAKSTLSFKSKIENLKNAPNADNIIYKERNFIMSKINGLQNDIKLWENNIGFFASSKKADVLKSEFEQKISKAKNEISILEEKLKILKNA